MNRLRSVMGVLALGLLAGAVSADAPKVEAPVATGHGNCCDDQCCDNGGSWLAELEFTFFRYHRADGVQDGQAGANQIEFDFEVDPRITLGYINANDLGARLRYWSYDHSATSGADTISVDASVLDLEAFKVIKLTCDTRIELSLGFRHADFDEVLFFDGAPDEITSFEGWGGVVGLQVNQKVWGGEIYGRARGAILMADKDAAFGAAAETPYSFFDSTHTIFELAMGYEGSRALRNGSILTYRAGIEWQNWANFSVTDNSTVTEDVPCDVGFGGFVLGIGLQY